MTNAHFQGWTENQMKSEFAKANAELNGLTRKMKDASTRKARAAAMIASFNRSPQPSM